MDNAENQVYYALLTPQDFQKRLREAPIAYLPLGTLEWHGPHLPIGADGLQSQGFFARLAGRVGGVVLPMLFLGPDLRRFQDGRDFYGMDIYGAAGGTPEQLAGSAYWLEDELFGRILERILANLARAGFKIVVAHGHGPSTDYFAEHIPQWQTQFGLKLFHCRREEETDGLGLQIDHAAANETSLTMALYPDLVHMEYLPQDLQEWPKAISGKDPRLFAGAEFGEQIIQVQLDRMEKMLREALAAGFDIVR